MKTRVEIEGLRCAGRSKRWRRLEANTAAFTACRIEKDFRTGNGSIRLVQGAPGIFTARFTAAFGSPHLIGFADFTQAERYVALRSYPCPPRNTQRARADDARGACAQCCPRQLMTDHIGVPTNAADAGRDGGPQPTTAACERKV
jgi:hypothetical protein